MISDRGEVLEQTAVVIPSYNAARHLRDVIEAVARFISRERIIVVDDGSKDETSEVARAAATIIIRHEKNLGKGAALRAGIMRAHEMGYAYAITLDADGQHNPAEIPRFIAHEEESSAEIIIGDRMSDKTGMPLIRIFSNSLTSWVLTKKAGQKIPDSQSGYRMLKTDFFSKLDLETTRYETESEILIKARKHGARIESIPIETIYGDERSAIHPLSDTLRFFRLVIKSLFW